MDSFFTPPESPNDHDLFFTPPSSPPLPVPDDLDLLPADLLSLDGESLSVLEKIYLYSRSNAYYHRIFIVHKLSQYLDHVSPQEAVEYVLPLLSGLAMDQDDSVKEALAEVLVPVIWWFFSHCQLIPEDLSNEQVYASSSSTVTISVQAFTPILGTLLLNENKRVGILARDALVGFLTAMNKADEIAFGIKKHRRRRALQPWESPDEEDTNHILPSVGLFGPRERALFRQEILQQIVVGLGQLEDEDQVHREPSSHQPQQLHPTDWINPYFPPVSAAPSPSSPPSPPSDHHSTQASLSSSPSHSPVRTESVSRSSVHGTPKSMDNDVLEYYEDPATLGRIACMSLVAAVTAGGPLDDDTLRSFLDDVERIVHDPYFKVRQAASFALGALAKEIPDELVPRLMPLFDSLRWDTIWVVRHSALFALPAILGRLSPAHRRTVALETVVALSTDKHATVRCGVLECLGEVLYTFVDDDSGPPEQLVQLFLGRKEDKKVRTGQKETHLTLQSALILLNAKLQTHITPLEAFYTQGKRPLICAFNFPAVVLTLGGDRWINLRENYLDLVKNPNVNISRTLAASVGEIAKIIGAEKARRDLLEVWHGFLNSIEVDVRMKAMESLLDLMKMVIGDDKKKKFGLDMVNAVRNAWQGNLFKAWREREYVQKKFLFWLTALWEPPIDAETVGIFRDLLMGGLEDAAANVREAAVANIPNVWALCSNSGDAVESFHCGIRKLANSPISRRRMTFVACQQILVSSLDKEGHALMSLDDATLQVIRTLTNDGIEGVRIGVARLVALVYRNLLRKGIPVPSALHELLSCLSRDVSLEVRSFAARAALEESANRADTPPPENKRGRDRVDQVALFSRPPISLRIKTSEAGPETHSYGFNDDMDVDMDTSYDTAAVIPGLSSNAVSEIYCGQSFHGRANTQVQVPV